MLKLVTSFSKKLPVPGEEYSSQSFHAGIELELSDSLKPEEIQARIHDVSELLKASVEQELAGTKDRALRPEEPLTAARRSPDAGDKARATNRQLRYIVDLATHEGFTLSELDIHIQKLYGVTSLYELNRRQASALLDSLQEKKIAA